ncbi:hypothetical protein BT63DRAFT_107731 [Microthyrium microscopicum]|uniref:Uncharacterized protein n=1 Tax=Microthyrium microscopicum TaxID=703497 RepID=A0A6A6TWC4_9PEZI|nr:hypothetical protein BT63DRAFT_107731 [Microthyrium microscopicum]
MNPSRPQCRRLAKQLSSSQPHNFIWISDSILNNAYNRFANVVKKRHGSSVPGPLEAQRRLGKRRMGQYQSYSPASAIDIGALFGSKLFASTAWKAKEPAWEPPDGRIFPALAESRRQPRKRKKSKEDAAHLLAGLAEHYLAPKQVVEPLPAESRPLPRKRKRKEDAVHLLASLAEHYLAPEPVLAPTWPDDALADVITTANESREAFESLLDRVAPFQELLRFLGNPANIAPGSACFSTLLERLKDEQVSSSEFRQYIHCLRQALISGLVDSKDLHRVLDALPIWIEPGGKQKEAGITVGVYSAIVHGLAECKVQESPDAIVLQKLRLQVGQFLDVPGMRAIQFKLFKICWPLQIRESIVPNVASKVPREELDTEMTALFAAIHSKSGSRGRKSLGPLPLQSQVAEIQLLLYWTSLACQSTAQVKNKSAVTSTLFTEHHLKAAIQYLSERSYSSSQWCIVGDIDYQPDSIITTITRHLSMDQKATDLLRTWLTALFHTSIFLAHRDVAPVVALISHKFQYSMPKIWYDVFLEISRNSTTGAALQLLPELSATQHCRLLLCFGFGSYFTRPRERAIADETTLGRHDQVVARAAWLTELALHRPRNYNATEAPDEFIALISAWAHVGLQWGFEMDVVVKILHSLHGGIGVVLDFLHLLIKAGIQHSYEPGAQLGTIVRIASYLYEQCASEAERERLVFYTWELSKKLLDQSSWRTFKFNETAKLKLDSGVCYPMSASGYLPLVEKVAWLAANDEAMPSWMAFTIVYYFSRLLRVNGHAHTNGIGRALSMAGIFRPLQETRGYTRSRAQFVLGYLRRCGTDKKLLSQMDLLMRRWQRLALHQKEQAAEIFHFKALQSLNVLRDQGVYDLYSFHEGNAQLQEPWNHTPQPRSQPEWSGDRRSIREHVATQLERIKSTFSKVDTASRGILNPYVSAGEQLAQGAKSNSKSISVLHKARVTATGRIINDRDSDKHDVKKTNLNKGVVFLLRTFQPRHNSAPSLVNAVSSTIAPSPVGLAAHDSTSVAKHDASNATTVLQRSGFPARRAATIESSLFVSKQVAVADSKKAIFAALRYPNTAWRKVGDVPDSAPPNTISKKLVLTSQPDNEVQPESLNGHIVSRPLQHTANDLKQRHLLDLTEPFKLVNPDRDEQPAWMNQKLPKTAEYQAKNLFATPTAEHLYDLVRLSNLETQRMIDGFSPTSPNLAFPSSSKILHIPKIQSAKAMKYSAIKLDIQTKPSVGHKRQWHLSRSPTLQTAMGGSALQTTLQKLGRGFSTTRYLKIVEDDEKRPPNTSSSTSVRSHTREAATLAVAKRLLERLQDIAADSHEQHNYRPGQTHKTLTFRAPADEDPEKLTVKEGNAKDSIAEHPTTQVSFAKGASLSSHLGRATTTRQADTSPNEPTVLQSVIVNSHWNEQHIPQQQLYDPGRKLRVIRRQRGALDTIAASMLNLHRARQVNPETIAVSHESIPKASIAKAGPAAIEGAAIDDLGGLDNRVLRSGDTMQDTYVHASTWRTIRLSKMMHPSQKKSGKDNPTRKKTRKDEVVGKKAGSLQVSALSKLGD